MVLHTATQLRRKEHMNIYIGNLSPRTSEEELRGVFEAFGEVDSVRIIKDNFTGKSKGFGFVEMSNQSQAQAAIAGLNGKELGGSALTGIRLKLVCVKHKKAGNCFSSLLRLPDKGYLVKASLPWLPMALWFPARFRNLHGHLPASF